MWNKNNLLYGGVGEIIPTVTENGGKMRLLTTIVIIFTFYILFVAIIATYAPAFLNSISGLIRTVICIFFLIVYQPFGGKSNGIDEINKTIVWIGILFIFLSNIINTAIIKNIKNINTVLTKVSSY